MPTRKARRVVYQSRTDVDQGRPSGEVSRPGEVAANPLFGVAMLKLALELKKSPRGSFDEMTTDVVRRMGLDDGEFRRFLAQQGGLLRAFVRPASPAR